MRKLAILLAVMVGVMGFMADSAHAQQKYPLGYGNVAFKVDYLRFTSSDMDDLGIANAPYLGAEFFFPVFVPNFYLGLESGYAWSSGDRDFTFFTVQGLPVRVRLDLDVDYVPIELNGKYVFDLSHCWAMAFGGGVSINYFNVETSGDVQGAVINSDGESDWLFGGQFFMDLNYKSGPWFFGANMKFQITEDISLREFDTDVSASNFRVGGQLGYMF